MRPVKCPGVIVLFYITVELASISVGLHLIKDTFCTDPCDFILEALFNSVNLMLGSTGMMWAVSASNSCFFQSFL